MKTIISLSLATMLFVLSILSINVSAATYQYVNTAGNIQSVEAVSASQALVIAPNISAHSGVMLYGGLSTTVAYVSVNNNDKVPYVTYQYVNIVGQVQTITASDSTQAFSLATNIDPHSGVMRVGAYQEGI